jgi:GTP-binding protein
MVDIINAKFVTSAPDIKLAPPEDLPEVAFLARSNVGKSSLLNSLVKHKGMAKVSSTPGKTQLINFFSLEFREIETDERQSARFVDLPGFGYARVSKSIKSQWQRSLTQFIAEREQIKLFIHLVDARHPDLEIDAQVDEYLSEIVEEDQVLLRVFTKMDKLNQKELGVLRRDYFGSLMISNSKKRGIDKLTQIIHSILFEEISDEQTDSFEEEAE